MPDDLTRGGAKTDKKTACYEDLKLRILALDIAPGSALDELQLCDTYGLSRTPLREVFQRLAGEGYVVLEANRGASVASMDLATMRSFFQTAPMIYAAVGRLAVEGARPGDIDELKRVQDRFRVAVETRDAEAMSRLNHRFHALLGAITGNVYLIASLNRLLIDHTRMSHRFYRPRPATGRDRVAQACAHHDAMISAIEARDGDAMAEVTLEHWELSRSEIEKYISPDPLPVEATDHRGESLDAV